MTKEWKECPFCGSKDGAIVADRKSHFVVCSGCKARGPEEMNTDFARAKWNHRIIANEQNGRVERRWIPVEERLPEVEHAVLALWERKVQSVESMFRDGSWTISGNVTHWMPLPPLPRREVQG